MGAGGGTIGALSAMPALAGLLDKTLDRSVDRSVDLDCLCDAEQLKAPRQASQRGGLRFGVFGRSAKRTPAGGSSAPSPSAAPESGDLYRVLATQGANGSFEPTNVVWDLLRADGRNASHWPQEIERTAPAMAGGLLDRDAVVRTVVALILLRSHFADRQSLWRRAAAKAVLFLAHTFGCPLADVERWLKDLEARLLTPKP